MNQCCISVSSSNMAKDYGSWTLIELKEELRKRKAKMTGKKAVLVQRLMDYDMLFGGLVNDSEETYRIKVPNPDQFRDVTSESNLPYITEQDLQQYSELAERENLQTSRNLYNERFLQTARVAYSGGEYFITAMCSSEMRKSVSYNITIRAKNNLIIESQCECAAGMGPYAQCKHVMVLVCGLIDFTNNKEIKRYISCTSMLQSFHCPTNPYTGNPVKAEEINLKLKSAKDIANFDPRPGTSSQTNNEYTDYLVNSAINFCAQENLKMPILQLRKPANKRALYNDHDYFERCEEERYIESLKKNKCDLEKLEIETKNNQKVWKNERKLRVQSSDFGKICKCAENKKMKLSRTLLKGADLNTAAIQHGKINEKVAIQHFSLHTNLKVSQSGIIVNQNIQHLGCTPDGIVEDGGLLEVKCPYNARQKQATPENIPYLYLCDESGVFKLKKDHDYYYQAQGQMLCTNKNFVYFFVYTVTDFNIIKINRDEQFIAEMAGKLNHFYECYYKKALIEKYLYEEK